MQATITWDEQKVQKLVEEAKQARRRVRRVGWVVCAMAALVSFLLVPFGLRESDRATAETTTGRAGYEERDAWYRVTLFPSPLPDYQRRPYQFGWIAVYLWCGLFLISWPATRRLVGIFLIVGGIMCLMALALIGLAAVAHFVWRLGPAPGQRELISHAIAGVAGVIQVSCWSVLERPSSVFVCDHLRGQPNEINVVLGLLQAEDKEFQAIRDEAGLRLTVSPPA